MVIEIALFLQAALSPALQPEEVTRTHIIEYSIASYPGPCPCPYNLMRNGARCGGRSAYSKPGGYEPYCYDHDLSDELFEFEKARLIEIIEHGALGY